MSLAAAARFVFYGRLPPSLRPLHYACNANAGGFLARSLEDAFLGHPHAGLLLLELQHSTLFVVAG